MDADFSTLGDTCREDLEYIETDSPAWISPYEQRLNLNTHIVNVGEVKRWVDRALVKRTLWIQYYSTYSIGQLAHAVLHGITILARM